MKVVKVMTVVVIVYVGTVVIGIFTVTVVVEVVTVLEVVTTVGWMMHFLACYFMKRNVYYILQHHLIHDTNSQKQFFLVTWKKK